jgi:hypothetical protein
MRVSDATKQARNSSIALGKFWMWRAVVQVQQALANTRTDVEALMKG